MKKIFTYVILLLLLTTVALPIGGGSKIYISDICIVFVSIIYIIGIVQKKKTLTKHQKIIVLSMGTMISYLLATSIYHTLQNGFNQNNLLLIRNFYMSFFILFFASENKITSKIIENTVLIFISVSNAFQLVYFALNSSLRTSPLFYTVVLYNLVAIMLLVLLFNIWFEGTTKLKRNIAGLNILLIILFVPLTGSRSSIVLVLIFTVLYSLFFSIRNGKKGIKKLLTGILLLCLLSGTIFLGLLVTNNTKGLDTISRSIGIKRDGLSSLSVPSKNATQSEKIAAEAVNIDDGSRSDSFRDFINDKAEAVVRENFILGAGEIHVKFYDNVNVKRFMQPHNFVLEALLGYGLIGTIIFFTILLLPFVLKETRFKKPQNFLLVFLTLSGFMVYAWAQPSLNRMLPLQIYFLIYLYYLKTDRGVKKRKRKSRKQTLVIQKRGRNYDE